MHYKNLSMSQELDEIKSILEELPEFSFSENDKKEILNQSLIKAFDGTFAFLVDFHAQLKSEYYNFQTIRCTFFQLAAKILRSYSIAHKFFIKDLSFGDPKIYQIESQKLTVPQYILFNDKTINKKSILRFFPRIGYFKRVLVLHSILSIITIRVWPI